MTTASKSQGKSKVTSKEAIDSVSRGSIVTMGVASALVGLWAVACLVSAMVGSMGPIELIKNWFSAIIGA
ncbi:MAG: hypothetical protein HGA96_07105 [Desulfobulbaceae bacterium]|nr:hypothetical protein [Desulfobulbaceae bacterium]